MKNVIIAIFVAAIICTFWFFGSYPKALYYIDVAYKFVGDSLMAAVFHRPVTINDLHNKYNSGSARKVKVLLMPGHEPDYGGAEYKDLLERDMNVDLTKYLEAFLKNNGHYDVVVARDKLNWNPIFEDYFKTNWNNIMTFASESKQENIQLVKSGAVVPMVSQVSSYARSDVALRLYGINKWGNENGVDIAIHVHFNDNPGHNPYNPGSHSGFSIYVPEHQYLNSTTTKAVADAVFKRLNKYNAVSDLPLESEGIIEDPELIALGVYNSNDAASMLIEYGYIYEPQFEKAEVRDKVIKDLAFQTYLGLEDFFGATNNSNYKTSEAYAYDTLMLPHQWNSELSTATAQASTDDILSLQSALLVDGVYPIPGKTKNDCPRTGKFGPCTQGAVSAFQTKYGITGENGVVGVQTRTILNQKYSTPQTI